MEEFLQEILTGTLSNLIWVIIVFGVLYVRDSKKRQQIAYCAEAYLTYLIKSTALVKNSIYPYIFLIDSKIIQGTILATLLSSINQVCGNISNQTQEALTLVENRNLQDKILQLHQKVTLFQAHVSASQIAVDLVVGNPEELVEGKRQQQEMDSFKSFAKNFDTLVREIYTAFPETTKQRISQEILAILEQKSPLQERYEK